MNPIDPRTTALLVIDIQNGWCHPEGAMAKAGLNMTAQQAVVPQIRRLVESCRAVGCKIIWSKTEHIPEDVTQVRRRIPSHLKKLNMIPAPQGTWHAEFLDAIKDVQRPEDHYVIKHRMSMFYSTTLDVLLRMLGISHLIVSGVSTNNCIESTIRDAYFRDFDITVVEDCVAGSHPDLHRATLRNVQLFFGEVVLLQDFIGAHAGALPQPSMQA